MEIQEYIQSGIIESYVLGLSTDDEVAELDSLRKNHPEIEVSMIEFSDALEQQAFANGIAPAVETKQKILDVLKGEKENRNNLTSNLTTNVLLNKLSTKIHTIHLWKNLAAAAVILFLISTALNFFLYNKYNKKNIDYEALLSEKNGLLTDNNIIQAKLKEWKSAAEMMNDPAVLMIKLNAVTGKENNKALVFWNSKSKDVYLMINKLPLPKPGKQYQLWALMDGKPIDAGIIADYTTTCKMKNISNAQAFAITLEKTGGSPSPTMDALYVFGKA